MTREEAIKILKSMSDVSTQGEAIDMAIEALQFVEHFDLLKEYQSLQEVVRCKDCRWWNSETKGCKRNPSVASTERGGAMRLIDADALKRRAITVRFFGKDIMMVSTSEIDDAPTIDAVEVVRCKDCRHKVHCHETVAHTRIHDDFKEHWSEPIEWCSRGERKGDDSK